MGIPSNQYIVIFKKETPKEVVDKAIDDVKNQGPSTHSP
jgi:hypothetical protein